MRFVYTSEILPMNTSIMLTEQRFHLSFLGPLAKWVLVHFLSRELIRRPYSNRHYFLETKLSASETNNNHDF